MSASTPTPAPGTPGPAPSGGRSDDEQWQSDSITLELRSLRTDILGLGRDLAGISRPDKPGRARTLAFARFGLVLILAGLLGNQYAVVREAQRKHDDLLRTLNGVCQQRNEVQAATLYLASELAQREQDPAKAAIYRTVYEKTGPVPRCDERYPVD